MTAQVKLLDASNNPVTPANPLPVALQGPITISSEVEIKNDSGNPVPVSLASAPLPTGAATDVTVATVTTSLGTDGPTPAAIPGTGVRGWLRSIYDLLKATLTVDVTDRAARLVGVISGTVTANAGTGTFGIRALVSGTDSVTVVPSGTQAVSGSVSINNLPATQAVSGTVTANAGSGTFNTRALVPGTDSVTTVPSGTQAVSGSVSVSNLPATQTVAGTVTANAGSGTFNTRALAAGTDSVTTTPSGTQNVSITSGVGTAAGTPVFETPVVAGVAVSASNPLPVNISRAYTGAFSATAAWTNSSTAAGAVPFAMRNTGTKNAYIKKIRAVYSSSAATATNTQKALGLNFISAATPTGGTAILVANKNPASATVSSLGNAQFLPAGLTMTGVTKGAQFDTVAVYTPAGGRFEQIFEYAGDDESQELILPAGYGIALYAITALAATDALAITVEWAER